eukprot:773188-Pelagomonas_calceolata.AAC.5
MLCPLPGCFLLDTALHILSGCQNHIISKKKIGRRNAAGRITTKALGKSPCGGAAPDALNVKRLLRRLLSTLVTKIRHGLLLATLLIPINFSISWWGGCMEMMISCCNATFKYLHMPQT